MYGFKMQFNSSHLVAIKSVLAITVKGQRALSYSFFIREFCRILVKNITLKHKKAMPVRFFPLSKEMGGSRL